MATAKKTDAPASQTSSRRERPFKKLDPRGKKVKKRQVRAEQKAALFQRSLPKAQLAAPFDGTYTAELGALLSDLVADGCTLDNICTLPNMPPLRAMLRWIADTNHPFSKLYYDAKKLLVALYEERAYTAAVTPLIGVKKVKRQVLDRDGDPVDVVETSEYDNVERSKLMLQGYQWTLSHQAPRKHGRQADVNSGQPNEQLKALIESLNAGPVD